MYTTDENTKNCTNHRKNEFLEIFNDEPIIQGSGCKHAINQKDRSTVVIVRVNADFTIYYLPMLPTYRQQESHNCYYGKLS